VIIFSLLVLAATGLFSQQSDFPKLTDSYLGQKLPGMIPEIFIPGIILVEKYNHSPVLINPDGSETYKILDYETKYN
jgi:hypothetical protein